MKNTIELEWVRPVTAGDLPAKEILEGMTRINAQEQTRLASEKGPFSSHKAYTDIAYWRGQYYCIFRVGTAHWSDDGHWEIFVSDDSERWGFIRRIDAKGDARDPHFLVTENRLIALIGDARSSKNGGMQYRCVYTEDGKKWSKPVECAPEGYVLWYPKRSGTSYYAAAYDAGPDVSLFSSTDGLSWKRISTICQTEPENGEGETCLHFYQDGRALAIVRQGGTIGPDWNDLIVHRCKVMCCDKAPYDYWYERPLKETLSIEGQQCLEVKNRLYVCGRNYHRNPVRRAEIFRQTVLFRVEADRFIPELILPSGGDTAYCGMLNRPDGKLLVSYYTGTRERSDIMVALVIVD